MKLNKGKAAVFAAATVAAVGAAGVGYAYFSGGSASGDGSATVGSATAWSVTAGAGTGSIYPSQGALLTRSHAVVGFTVTNTGSGYQNLTTVGGAVKTEPDTIDGSPNPHAGEVDAASGPVVGCKASWFSVANDPANATLPKDLAPSGTYTGNVFVYLNDDGTNQDLCKGAVPVVTVSASSTS